MRKIAAIVGRPNVGKSALFNRIVGRRISIVHDMPGVTRDRVSAEVEFRGRSFTLVDTGGIGLVRGEKTGDRIMSVAMEQVDAAIEAAEVIIMVVNVQEGVVALDEEVARRLHDSGKKVLLAANKVDNASAEKLIDEFAVLGFEDIYGTSAIHGRGVDDLLRDLCRNFPHKPREQPKPADEMGEGESTQAGPFKLAIVGRPNVGKSSLVNALTQSERVVVSDIPGTTRDSVDVPLRIEGEGEALDLLLIDTAGLRKKRRVKDSVEFFSAKRTEDSIERCDLVVLVIDADHGIHEQDKKIADLITSNNRACIIVVNKWDLVSEAIEEARKKQNERRRRMKPAEFEATREAASLHEFAEWVQEQLFFMSYAPVIFSSAVTGLNLDKLLETVRFVRDQWHQVIPTGIFNRVLRDIVESRPVSSRTGRQMKIYYGNQVRHGPPTFLLFTNLSEALDDNYRKFLEGALRKAFGFEGCPLVLVSKSRPKTVEPVRRRKKSPAKKSSSPKASVRKQSSSGAKAPSSRRGVNRGSAGKKSGRPRNK
jgi:GTP-binding protein